MPTEQTQSTPPVASPPPRLAGRLAAREAARVELHERMAERIREAEAVRRG